MVGGSFSDLMRSVRLSLLIWPLSATVWRSSSAIFVTELQAQMTAVECRVM
jgi:hypothetical protein